MNSTPHFVTRDRTARINSGTSPPLFNPACCPALIVTADDFGIGINTSRGIIEAHLRGPVTCTSLMSVTGDRVSASIPLLERAPLLEVGLHLVFSGGEKPLMATRASGLLGRDGRFVSNARLWFRALTGKLNLSAVTDEMRAQARAFARLMGRPPAYVDGHHHAHQLPVLRDALTQLVELGELPALTRSTRESAPLADLPGNRLRRLAARQLARAALPAFERANLRTNDFFFGMLAGYQLNQAFPWADYFAAIETIQDGSLVGEWVVHPGFEDPQLVGLDSYRDQRVRECQALVDEAQRPIWQGWRRLTKSVALQPIRRAVEGIG